MSSLQGHARLCATLARYLEPRLTALRGAAPALDASARAALDELETLLGGLSTFGALEIARHPLQLADWLEQRAADWRQRAGEATFSLIAAPELPASIAADPEALARALDELVDNAAASRARRITLRAALRELPVEALPTHLAPGSYLSLVVEDDGCGLPGGLRRRALWPGVSTRGRAGVGLSIVYGVAAAHGGRVELNSDGSAGTRVALELPLATKRGASADARCLTVLLVDDEPLARKAVDRVLRMRGHELLVAEDGPSALARAAEYGAPIDLLISDVNMPGMTGFEMAAKLREDRPEMALVFICGYPPETLDAALRPCQMLAKPFTHAELFQAIERSLERRSV